MDTEALRQAAEHAGILALTAGFLSGLVFSFNPVALASIPVSLAYVTKARSAKQSALFGAFFTAAMVIVQTLLGFFARFGAASAASPYGEQLGSVRGPPPYLLASLTPPVLHLP